MVKVLVQYPSGHDFDKDYYVKTHMPLVEKAWASKGLIDWEILYFPAGAPYQVLAILNWPTTDAWTAASTHEDAKAVFADIPNFTASKPIVLVGDIAAGNKCA